MINFKQYLEESRSAPLYHGTGPLSIRNILLDKKGIEPRTLHTNLKLMRKLTAPFTGGETKGVSLTRDIKFAEWFAGGIVLELDQAKLSQRYKIIPISYFQHDMKSARVQSKIGRSAIAVNEYEEFIVTDKPIPVTYIKRLWITKSQFMRFDALLNEIRQEYGNTFIHTF